jgi:MFS family permease
MPRLSRGGTLALVCGVYIGAGLCLSSIGPSLPALAANVGRDVAAVGAQFTAFSLGTITVQLAAAPLGQRLGQRAVLGLGALLLGLGILGESLSTSLTALLACALLGGLGFGCVLAAGVLLAAGLFAERSTSVLNLVNVFFGVGSILGPLVAGAARARLEAPQLAMLLGAGLLLLLAPGFLWAAEAARRGEARSGEPELPVPWGLVTLLGLLLAAYSGTEIAVGGWAALYLEESTSLAPTQVALAVSSFWLALTAGRALGALLGLVVGARALLAGALATLTLAVGLLLASVGSAALSVLALALFGLGCGPVFPTLMAFVATSSHGRGAATSLALGVGNMGAGLLPPLLGVVLSGSGPRAGALLLFGAALTMLALFSLVSLAGARRPTVAAG